MAESKLLVLWTCSAAVVTMLRFFHAAGPGYDLGLQIEAAHNLLAGNGLALYHAAPNLSDPARLVTLTHFPSGYSLAAATLFGVGLSVAMVVKILGAAATILGWWGWGRLAQPFFGEGLNRGPGWKWAGFVTATFTPVLFTPPWWGTDIFLWAAVPWVVLIVVRASNENWGLGRWLDGLAGALCGFAFLMRYASVFLAGYAACVILWQSRVSPRVLTRRWTAFALGLLPALALQLYVNHILSNSPASPGGLSFDVEAGTAVHRLWHGIGLLHTANYPWAFWVPGIAMNLLFPEVAGALPWQLGVTFVGFIVLILAVKAYGTDGRPAARDPRSVALGLFVAVPFTLLGSMTLGSYGYVGDLRYYGPLVPLSVLVVFSIASMTDLSKGKTAIRLLQTSCALYLTGYIAMVLVYMVFLFVPGRIGTSQREKLMAIDLHDWPSMAVTYELSPARRFVMRLVNQQPDTLLVTSKAGWFYWDPALDRSKLYELDCGRMPATYLDGPARIVILTFDEGQPQELWYYIGNGLHGSHKRSDCFEHLPDLKVVRRFPEEGLKVLEAEVEAGQLTILRQSPSS